MKFVLEIEGFTLEKGFVFKELTLWSLQNNFDRHFFVKPPCPFNWLSEKDKRIVKYCEKFIHKIHWSAGRDTFLEVRSYLQRLLNDTTNSVVVYTKGESKINVFKQVLGLKCEIQDINQLELKSNQEWNEDLKKYMESINSTEFCPLKFHTNHSHCTQVKAAVIAEFLNSYINKDECMFTEEPPVSMETEEMRRTDEEEAH
jgi:hypothetical protein